VTAAAHLAEYEAAGPAAVRAHLGTEHPVAWRSFGLGGPEACQEIHRRIHADDDPARTFPTEARP
jgi:hypothetical protein